MEKAGDILDSFFRRTNISGGGNYVAFYRSWEQIVGLDIASHTNLSEIRNNTVCVEVDHPAWMQMVQMRQDNILRTIQKRFPTLEVKSLQLRLVESLGLPVRSVSPPAAGKPRPQAQTGAETQPRLPPAAASPLSENQSIDRIESDSLRASLRRLRAAISDRDLPR